MVLSLDADTILQYRHLADAENGLIAAALELALLGEVHTASELMVLLVTNPVPRLRQIDETNLYFAWQQTGHWPEVQPAPEREELLSRLRDAYDGEWGNVPEQQRTFDASGMEACLGSATPTAQVGPLYKAPRLVKALDISLLLHPRLEVDTIQAEGIRVSDLHESTAAILRRIAARWDQEYQRVFLAHAERLWPLFAAGIMADALGMTKESVRDKAKVIYAAFSARLKHGPSQHPLGAFSMDALLQMANENSVGPSSPGMFHWTRDTHVGPRPVTLLREPATDVELRELETRLDVVLPVDLRELLQASNGVGVNCDGLFNGYCPAPPIHGVADIQWVGLEEYGPLMTILEVPDNVIREEELRVERVLEISSRDVDRLWLVPPREMQSIREAYVLEREQADDRGKAVIARAIREFAGGEEEWNSLQWCCIVADDTDNWAYPSLRSYLNELVLSSFKVDRIVWEDHSM